ncbi:hypothetical protein Leryth_026391 [Lithospermum erythrorhizon]|nr:hypothetical protein Leryth_026391 [Lithospermum erythrorhizon]
MSTIVYQGVQTCFESQLIETTILKLKVAQLTSTENKCHIQEFNKNQENIPSQGFHCMQNISNIPSSPNEKQNSYIHPLTKTSPKLSQKSLELCTENLGSETGSDDGVDIDILLFNDNVENSISDGLVSEVEEKKVAFKLESRISKKETPRSFPPPLTSMRSSNSIQCRTHREDGRLIIEAIEIPSRNTYLQAERSNGRLRLSFINDCDIYFDTEMNNEGDEINDDYESYDYVEDCNEGEELAYDDDDEENDENIEEEIILNKIEVEGEIGIEKFQRLSRCIESGHDNRNLCNWRNSLWVATS